MSSRLQHLLLVSTEELFDIKAWSGIPYSLRCALERQVERVTSFQPPRPRRTPIASAQRLLFGASRFPLWISQPTLRANARAVQAEIERVRPDAVLSISSQCIAELTNPGVPVFLFSDAPYQAFMNAYAQWETAPEALPRFTRQEASAGRRIDGLCFGSAWACDEAARLYDFPEADRGKLHVAPLGANWIPTLPREEILHLAANRSLNRIEFLFVGRDWERKGGPLAVRITEGLCKLGISAHLHVVGCRPELGGVSGPDGFVSIHGPLYQTDPVESVRLAELFHRSHFLLVPTVAECFGIVFAEAQAFALPPVSRAVHALPSIVEDGVTGLLFPPEAGPEPYIERIAGLVRDPERYRAMTLHARQRFESALTWNQTARSIIHAVDSRLTW